MAKLDVYAIARRQWKQSESKSTEGSLLKMHLVCGRYSVKLKVG